MRIFTFIIVLGLLGYTICPKPQRQSERQRIFLSTYRQDNAAAVRNRARSEEPNRKVSDSEIQDSAFRYGLELITNGDFATAFSQEPACHGIVLVDDKHAANVWTVFTEDGSYSLGKPHTTALGGDFSGMGTPSENARAVCHIVNGVGGKVE